MRLPEGGWQKSLPTFSPTATNILTANLQKQLQHDRVVRLNTSRIYHILSICIFLIGGVTPSCSAYARLPPAELFNTPAKLIARSPLGLVSRSITVVGKKFTIYPSLTATRSMTVYLMTGVLWNTLHSTKQWLHCCNKATEHSLWSHAQTASGCRDQFKRSGKI